MPPCALPWPAGLRQAPANIRWAASATEAADLVAAKIPDLVICDYRLGGPVDGLTLLTGIQGLDPKVRCVLHTGEDPFTTSQVSDFEVLFKPCSTQVLLELIEAVRLARRR